MRRFQSQDKMFCKMDLYNFINMLPFLFKRYFLLHLLHKKSFKLSKQQNGITSNANIDF